MSKTADGVYTLMHEAVMDNAHERTVGDRKSPQQSVTFEAEPGETFILSDVQNNLVHVRKTDIVWAKANLLHFFAETEDGTMLPTYNRLANQYLTDGRWIGAYGLIAMPQIRDCIRLLHADPSSRRAIVSMGGFPAVSDQNRPACWSFLHFLDSDGQLDLLVYQRSLNLYGVMPYDCIVLSNILLYVSTALDIPAGRLRWTIGSLHMVQADCTKQLLPMGEGCVTFHKDVLGDASVCLDKLKHNDLS